MWENKVRTKLAKAFLDALKEDQIPWHRCWNASPLSFGTGKPYRGINNLVLSLVASARGYEDRRWMTLRQANEKGWRVRKGERSTRVEHWHYYDTVLKRALTRAEVARIQKEEPERMKDVRLSATSYNVFNVAQIEGDVPPMVRQGPKLDAEKLAQHRDQFLTNLGVAFREGGGQAYYSPEHDTIHLPQISLFDSDYGYVCTLLHEAGHATGRPCRLDRQMLNEFGSPDYAREELRAEIASAFTAQALQLPYIDGAAGTTLENLTGNHKAYIQSWIAALEEDPNELFAAIKDANKIADYLLEHGRLLELAEEKELLTVEDLDKDQVAELEEEEPEP